MLDSRTLVLVFLALGLSFSGCRKKVTETVVYDNVIYEIEDQNLYQSNVEKTKQKSAEQYISILFGDLYGSALPTSDLLDLSELRRSIGDKQLVAELYLSDWVNDPSSAVPSDAMMRADIPAFVEDTFVRFFLRKPTSYEAYYLEDLISNDSDLSPEMIYSAFATSNEYMFY